jgi:hypothetical protein
MGFNVDFSGAGHLRASVGTTSYQLDIVTPIGNDRQPTSVPTFELSGLPLALHLDVRLRIGARQMYPTLT